ncbi:lysophospholipase [Paenibacillus sp. FSL W8-1187]|uniref:alpha/beta hydrolase n=1 Tax=unclassified Paenibacillus TaxID=185978 RepID=UPI00129A8509|nr:alpha/beta hydrolase [Paenibacillus sp. B01]QGG54936.1 alpha/beta fold hydrolase [Paenibacillus sp. B01]
MSYEELSWKSRDGVSIYGCRWMPEGEPVAAVGIVHGLGEHCGAYAHVASFFTERGFAVIAFDQRGHGRTEGRRGDCPGYDALLEPVERIVEDMQRRWPGLPRFLFCHSMGGNVALNFMLRRRPPLAGAVVAGPWLKLAPAPPPAKLLWGRLRERMQPGYRLVGANRRGTSDPDMQRRYDEDPLRHGRITLRTFAAVSQAGRWALSHAPELSVPLLLMHGGADRITSPRASRRFAQRAGERCSYREWPGFRHELHAEAGRQEVLACAADWMLGRCGNS